MVSEDPPTREHGKNFLGFSLQIAQMAPWSVPTDHVAGCTDERKMKKKVVEDKILLTYAL